MASKEWPNVTVLRRTPHLRHIMSILRSVDTEPPKFAATADLIARLVVAAALEHVEYEDLKVTTPTGTTYDGTRPAKQICGVSILRAGESMEHILREWMPSVVIGKVLIQRDEETALPKFVFDKLPSKICNCQVILLDPMLATGGSAMKAIEVLHSHGVPLANIVFCNIIASPEGIDTLTKRFPEVKVVTAEVDDHLNEKKYIIPGLGDYGDRYFGTI
ncbi:uracil phosphoribosyltransferase [Salpingoeca rosetta]|uniref:uracil phosphoribosyltransferase n=1 Tax=Salpingoeca rosetta (strain ATCC 50818 / BSB-021) TaxID=946362 RepID=F2UAE3_SALR5|nr:uracil phosphoribosyltransferase [Salpingoeca rosetta]EGD73718.1 uracil phosphoribosyltransferase [Salpingoeca rosetta]|eukprot:XP_004993999.1 uracil phosphoribosyltransferase [Salpingoeca rosetta]